MLDTNSTVLSYKHTHCSPVAHDERAGEACFLTKDTATALQYREGPKRYRSVIPRTSFKERSSSDRSGIEVAEEVLQL